MKRNNDPDIDVLDDQCKSLLEDEFINSEDPLYIPSSWTNNQAPIVPITDLGPRLPLVSLDQLQQPTITEEQIRRQAYLIWLQTKRDDPIANWHDAADQLNKTKK